MGRLNKPIPVKDSDEDIQKCLHCELDVCCDCLSFLNRTAGLYEKKLAEQKARESNAAIYNFDSVDYDIIDAYPLCDSISDLARTVNRSFQSVTYRLNKKLKLPSPKGRTYMEKKRIVERCRMR